MAFGLGVLLFAFGILISIALHEAGHMFAARAFGMRVRRYFIGFGPTLWSTAPRERVRSAAAAGTADVDVDAANVPANPAPLTTDTDVGSHPAGGAPQTEYGIKAIPLGGFCEIAGMTPLDELSEEEKPHAMYRKPWWQRVIVLSGGIAVNVLVALIVLYSVANIWGLPDHKADIRTKIGRAHV